MIHHKKFKLNRQSHHLWNRQNSYRKLKRFAVSLTSRISIVMKRIAKALLHEKGNI